MSKSIMKQMKLCVLTLSALGLLAACGDTGTTENPATDPEVEGPAVGEPATDPVEDPADEEDVDDET